MSTNGKLGVGSGTWVVLLLLAPVAEAQTRAPREHRGFWFSVGAGLGANLSDFGGVSKGAFAGHLRLGGSPSQQLQLGFETVGWGKDETGRTLTRGNASFVAMYYPNPAGGMFAKGGIGFSTVSAEQMSGNTTTTTSENGFGLTLGGGYDIRLGNNFYLTPNVDLLMQFLGSKTDPVLGNIPGMNTILVFTLGVTWH